MQKLNNCDIIEKTSKREVSDLDIDKEYSFRSRELYFKHSVTESPLCDAFYMHTHGMYELLYFVSGDATFVIEDKRYKLRRGDMVLIRPMKYHYIVIDSPAKYERYGILFDERALHIDNTCKVNESVEVVNLLEKSNSSDIIRKLDYYSEHLNDGDFRDVTVLLIKELFYDLGIKTETFEKDSARINPTLTKALKYINDNLFTLKGISEVADEIFVTESYLFRLFKSELKKSPKKYINDKRLLAAQNLLQMGEMPISVYERCGFSDYTSFYRNYKEYFGYPPSKESEYIE